MKSKYDLNDIVQDNQKLLDFILGEGQFLTNRPDNDYFRWLELEKYYRNLSDSSAEKKMIKKSVLDLFKRNNYSAKHTSILLGRIMVLDELRPLLINLITTSEINNLPLNIQEEIYISAKKLRITEISKNLVKYYMENKNLVGFLGGNMGISDFEKNIINDDDLWRVDCLANYYEDCTESEKVDIRLQLMGVIEKYHAILYLLSAYQEKKSSYADFRKLIEELQNKFV